MRQSLSAGRQTKPCRALRRNSTPSSRDETRSSRRLTNSSEKKLSSAKRRNERSTSSRRSSREFSSPCRRKLRAGEKARGPCSGSRQISKPRSPHKPANSQKSSQLSHNSSPLTSKPKTHCAKGPPHARSCARRRSEEHTSELQSHS